RIVHVEVVERDTGIVPGDFFGHLSPKTRGFQDVAFVHRGDPTSAQRREFKTDADQALYFLSPILHRVEGAFGRSFSFSAPGPIVQASGQFSDDDQIHAAPYDLVPQWGPTHRVG